MKAFQHEQRTFVAALRQISTELPQGVSARRMQVYQRLVYNNIDSLLSRALPICQQLLNHTGQWQPLIQQFIQNSKQLHSPYFADLSEALVRSLAHPTAALKSLDLPAFIAELAHYEWLELAAQLVPQSIECNPVLDISTLSDQQLLHCGITTTASLQIGHYHWPVMQISPATSETILAAGAKTEPYIIAVHCSVDGNTHFTALNSLSAALISQLQKQPALQLQQHLGQLFQSRLDITLQQLLCHAPELVRQLALNGLLQIKSNVEENH